MSLTSGATDVLSYLTLGHVFTSSMTGVTALLIIALAEAKRPTAVRAGISIASYLAGGALAAMVRPPKHAPDSARRSVRRLLSVEAVLLATYCLIAANAPQGAMGGLRDVLIVLSAMTMGIQSVAARQTHERGITTVVLNTTMTGIVVALTERCSGRRTQPLSAHFGLKLLAIMGYATGALVVAGTLMNHWFAADLVPLAATCAALSLYLRPSWG
jgi:uncharacterized membrane protein YoaK (UPF0700 family)